MRKLLRVVAVFVAVGYAAWRYWQSANRENAEAWAAGTDRVD